MLIKRGVEFNIQGRIDVHDDSLIASGCVFVDYDHGSLLGTNRAAGRLIGSTHAD